MVRQLSADPIQTDAPVYSSNLPINDKTTIQEKQKIFFVWYFLNLDQSFFMS